MFDFISDWFNFSNLMYLVILILASVVTLVSTKYRALVIEIKEVFEVIRKADEDGVRTEKEKEQIMKEILDVLRELLKMVWSPFKFKAKK